MAGDSTTPPPCLWAQRADKIYLTINVGDIKDAKIELEETQLHFTGIGGVDKKRYDVTIPFYKEVDISTSKYVVQHRNIPMVLMKKDDSEYWPALMKDKKKAHWLKTDFDKWREEDDSDAEGGDDMQLEDMMKNMGNFNAGEAGEGFGEDMPEEEDSDDEDLPDLE